MRVLRAGLRLILARRLGAVIRTVAPIDEVARRGLRLLGDAQRVGTHVGDQAHRALARDVDALIELLGDGHRAPGRHVELA